MKNPNSIRQKRIEQLKKMKDKPFKEKLQYFMEYYRTSALVGIAAVLVFSYMVYSFVTAKDCALYVIFLNSYAKQDLDLEQLNLDFLEYAGLDPEEYEVRIDTSLVIDNYSFGGFRDGTMTMAKEVASGSLDIAITTDSYVRQNRETGMFADLSEIFPDAVLKEYEDQLLYINSWEDDKGEYPVGIDVRSSGLMNSEMMPAYFCISSNSENPENAVLFFDFIMRE